MFPLDFLKDLILDIRFQSLVGLFVLVRWAWRQPRPRREASNKTVFITGCDSGMGHRMARRFDQMGMHVFAGCLQPAGKGALDLKRVCSDRLHVVPIDITNDQQVREAVAYVEANLPPGEKGLYCLVNNAGVLAYTDFELMTPGMCEEVLSINLMGTMRVTKHFLPLICRSPGLYCLVNNAGVLAYTDFELMTPGMCEEVLSINLMGTMRVTKHFLPLICRSPGRVVTITSILARLVYPGVAVYAATKHGLSGFFSALRFELQEKGVHVATVEPGDFSTTTDIMQWTQRHLDEIWSSMSPEEQKSKLHLFEKTKKKVKKTKCSEAEQERNYSFLLHDVEDAMLAEEPLWRYVSAPRATRIALWVLRSLPETWTFKLMGEKAISN